MIILSNCFNSMACFKAQAHSLLKADEANYGAETVHHILWLMAVVKAGSLEHAMRLGRWIFVLRNVSSGILWIIWRLPSLNPFLCKLPMRRLYKHSTIHNPICCFQASPFSCSRGQVLNPPSKYCSDKLIGEFGVCARVSKISRIVSLKSNLNSFTKHFKTFFFDN